MALGKSILRNLNNLFKLHDFLVNNIDLGNNIDVITIGLSTALLKLFHMIKSCSNYLNMVLLILLKVGYAISLPIELMTFVLILHSLNYFLFLFCNAKTFSGPTFV